MNLFYTYKYIIIKKPLLFDLLNFLSSLAVHLLLFLIFNTIPNITVKSADWKQIHTTKQKSGGKNWSGGMEVINMVHSSEVKVLESNLKSKTGTKSLKKAKIIDIKKKHAYNSKITMIKKQETQPESLVPKKETIEEKAAKQKFIPRIGAERGARSITEKSPLSMPFKEKTGQPSKKAGDEKGPIEKIAQKAPMKPKPEERIEEKKLEKKSPEPQEKVPPKKIDLEKKELPKPVIEKLTKLTEPAKIMKKMVFDRAPEKKTFTPIAPPLEKTEEEKKVIIKEKPLENIDKIEEAKKDITPQEKKIIPQGKMIKDASIEVAKKTIVTKPVITRVAGMEPKKISMAENKMVASEELKEKPAIPPDIEKEINKVEMQDKLKIGDPLGTFAKEVNDVKGVGPLVSFAPKGDKELTKALRTTAEKEKLKFADEKINLQAPDISNLQGKVEKSIVESTPLKQRLNFEPLVKQKFKQMNLAEAQKEPEVKEEKSEKLQEEIKNLAMEKDEKIGEKDDLKKILEKVTEEIKKEEKEKLYDTTTNIEEEFAFAVEKEEINNEAKIIGKENIVASGDRGEALKTVKIRTMLDRNPTSVTRRTPLTKVSMGGTVRPILGKNTSQEDMKKIEEYIEKTKREESKLGSEQDMLFNPIIQKIDIEALLFKEENAPTGAGGIKEETEDIVSPEDIQGMQIKEGAKSLEGPEAKGMFKEKGTFSEMKQEGSELEFGGKIIKDKDIGKFISGEKKLGELDQRFKEISSFVKAKKLSMGKQHKSPTIISVTHNATRTLGKGDEMVVMMKGDSGETAYFDIGLYRTDIPMNEVSPGVYRGMYRIVEGDNIINAQLVGYIINVDNVGTSLPAQNSITIDTSPGVTIATPPRDSVVDKAIQTITGVLDDQEVKNVVLSLNGNMLNIPVENGYFNTDIELIKGKNIIEVMAVNSKGDIGRDRIEITYATYKTGPKVTITFPQDGDIVNAAESPVVEIQGNVSDSNVSKAKLIANDFPMNISVISGMFQQKVVLFSEINSFVVEAIDKEGTIGMSEPINVKASGLGYYDAIISLTWDSPNADLDLILKNSTGKFVSHKAPNFKQNPNAINGGNLELDDKEGYGPEVITLKQAVAGLYSIHVNYYESNGDKTVNASVSVTLSDPEDQSKSKSKIFGPKILKVGDEWKVSFIGLPEKGFYAVE
ncbi:MAG: hypothetical protein HY934_09100 [Candidatus Firestonebacteria bacterium]|nr:hypothetical protein [Candidatus Firestonebacteria bacterium]